MPRITINVQNYTKRNLDRLIEEFGYTTWDDAVDIAVQTQIGIEDGQGSVPADSGRSSTEVTGIQNEDIQQSTAAPDEGKASPSSGYGTGFYPEIRLNELDTDKNQLNIRDWSTGRQSSLRPLERVSEVSAETELPIPPVDELGRIHPDAWVSTQWNSPLALVVAVRGLANLLAGPGCSPQSEPGFDLLSEFPGISRRIGGDTFDYCELVRQRGRAGAESDPETKSMYPSGFLNGLPVVDPDGPAMRRVIRENKAKNTKIQNQKWDEEYTSRQSKAISRFMNAFIGSVGKARWRDDQLQYQSSLLIPRGQDYYRVTSYAVKMRLLGHSDGRILLTKAGLELAGAGSFFLDAPVPLGGKLDGRELNVLLEQIKRNVPEEVDQFRALLSSIKVHQDEYGQGVNPAQIKRGLLNQFLRDCGLPDLGLLPPGESTTVEDLKADGPLLQEKFAAPEPIMGHRNAEAFVAARDKRTGALTRMVDFELIDRDITYPGTGTGMVSVIEITDAGEEFLQDVRR